MLPASLCIGETEARGILPSWDVGELLRLPGERGGTANPAVVLETARGRYFLKRRNRRYSAPEMLRHDHALMEHLAAKRLPTPLAIMSRDGCRWVDAGGAVYELYPYMPGDICGMVSEAQLAEAGRVLASYHHATSDFTLPPGKDWPRYHNPADTVAAINWALELISHEAKPTPAGRTPEAASRELRRLVELTERLARHFPDDEYWSYPTTTIHGDWHPGNVKYDGDRICGIFDLDWATRQPRLVDIADGIIYFAGKRERPLDPSDIRSLTATFRLDQHRVRSFVSGYLTSGHITASEYRALPKFLLARWLYCRADAMQRKIPRDEAVDYLLDGIWRPIAEICKTDISHTPG